MTILDQRDVRPIQTAYAGRLFRSRLEARWAVFYTALGIPWMHEFEGYALPDGVWYLPDFWLPEQKCFIEIKPDAPTDEELRKAHQLAMLTGQRVFLFIGQPGYHIDGGYPYGQLAANSAWLNGREDIDYTWCVCRCGVFGIEYYGRSERIQCCGHDRGFDKDYTYTDPRLLRAYDMANRARFARVDAAELPR